ncbi:MAG: 4-hydroxythreonine-4-phosphate dehydrogenase PdxA [Phycisphaerae bacterium]|nr:4-hydroxythreonine-4-phosphate dehydrogenase PdxA [Phycisphaerae bacterium]
MNNKPIIGITMGDPAGIGPEIIVQALSDPEIRALGKFIVYGINELLTYEADRAELNCYWRRDQHDNINRNYPNNVAVADYDEIGWNPKIKGPSKLGGQASLRFIEDAIDDAVDGKIDAIVTAPICKESWAMAGSTFSGHTELLASRTYSKRHAMMFVGGPFKVVLATIHEALFELRHIFNIGKVFTPIDLAHTALKDFFGIENPKIGVAALNPHAGENKRFGDEEQRIIEPAIVLAREHGIDVQGPFPADTLFHQALDGRFDIIVAMYHDQGLIPIKMLAFDKAVNVTIGLPIIRTSVDHGTAFDIAGQGIANPSSLKEAIKVAALMASKRHK